MDQHTVLNITADRLADIAMKTVMFYVPGRANNIPEILTSDDDYRLCGRYLAKTIELQSQFSYYEKLLSYQKNLAERAGKSSYEIEDLKDKIDIFTNLSNIMYNTNAALSRLGTFKNIENTYIKISGLEKYSGDITGTPWEGPSTLSEDELLSMDYCDLLSYMRPKYLYKIPLDLSSPDKLRIGGQMMIRCIVMYDYYLMLSLKARRKKRMLKRNGASKDEIYDETQREKLFVDLSKEMIRYYKTLSRLGTIEQYELEEYNMIERKYTDSPISQAG